MSFENSIKAIGEKLKTARELQGRSLDDIANSTRINLIFLNQIEKGVLPNLPITYIRAFIRAYASEVGIDLYDIFQESQISPQDSGTSDISSHALPFKYEIPVVVNGVSQEVPSGKFQKHQLRILFVLIFVIIVGLIGSILLFRSPQVSAPTKEISFTDVIKEQSSKLNPKMVATDSAMMAPIAITVDSLILEGVASESVWVRVVVDGSNSVDHMLPPFYKKRWKAKKSFLLSIGNGAGISFTLNGYKVGTLSTTKRPLKNIPINWDVLKRLQKK